MEQINTLLKEKRFEKVTSKRKVNEKYEQAKILAEYIDVPIFVIMRLQKKYGIEKTARLRSFLKDYPNLDKKRAIGLCHWYLKQK